MGDKGFRDRVSSHPEALKVETRVKHSYEKGDVKIYFDYDLRNRSHMTGHIVILEQALVDIRADLESFDKKSE